jgi:hypothetical protein
MAGDFCTDDSIPALLFVMLALMFFKPTIWKVYIPV